MPMDDLKKSWTTVYRDTLPALARSKSHSQTHWPVQSDHCFARIILDAVIGRDEVFDPISTSMKSMADGSCIPWTSKLKAPAIEYMSRAELKQCIELGEAIAEGKVDLVDLDEKSLAVRGKASKTSNTNRKRKQGDIGCLTLTLKPSETVHQLQSECELKKRRASQVDIRTALGASSTAALSPQSPAFVEPDLRDLIQSSKITPFRKRVFLALCQVPKGQVVRKHFNHIRFARNVMSTAIPIS